LNRCIFKDDAKMSPESLSCIVEDSIRVNGLFDKKIGADESTPISLL